MNGIDSIQAIIKHGEQNAESKLRLGARVNEKSWKASPNVLRVPGRGDASKLFSLWVVRVMSVELVLDLSYII